MGTHWSIEMHRRDIIAKLNCNGTNKMSFQTEQNLIK